MTVFDRVTTIVADDPNCDPDHWMSRQPCWQYRLFGRSRILNQPSSSFWVYGLGLLTLLPGLDLMITPYPDLPMAWYWGLGLALWGLGAIIAGTSYQAFAYEIKCRGRQEAAWTSWWELVYLILQFWSVLALFIAVSGETGTFTTISVAIMAIAYAVMILIGGFLPKKSLITFELMSLCCAPFCLAMLVINGGAYWQTGNAIDGHLAIIWLMLFAIMGAFKIYEKAGYTEKLWQRGFWLSENDILHILLVGWAFYLCFVIWPPLNRLIL